MSVRYALLSVYNKAGIVEFAQGLVALGWKIIASGGTAKVLRQAEIEVMDTGDLVGPPILGHRVVTLSREIHAALLSLDTPEDRAELERIQIPRIDLVYVDLYPLEDAIRQSGQLEEVIEKTDVGGPTMLRSAAKGRRIVISNASQRSEVLAWLRDGEPECEQMIATLAAEAERLCATYSLASARYHSDGKIDGMIGTLAWNLCYGENKERPATLFATDYDDPLAVHRFQHVGGNAPSSINVTDLDRGLNTLTRLTSMWIFNFEEIPMVGLALKHGKCCGAAVGRTKLEVVRRLIDCDPLSIFGGTLVFNFPMDFETASELRQYRRGKLKNAYDVIIAADYDDGASEELERKSGKTRVYANEALATELVAQLPMSMLIRPVRGGFIRIPPSNFILDLNDLRMVRHTPENAPPVTDQMKMDLVLAAAVCATTDSNTFTLACHGSVIANAGGQQSRVDVFELAFDKAKKRGHASKLTQAVGVSDSFCPYPDAIEVAVREKLGLLWSTIAPEPKPQVIEAGMQGGLNHWQLDDSFARLFFGHHGR